MGDEPFYAPNSTCEKRERQRRTPERSPFLIPPPWPFGGRRETQARLLCGHYCHAGSVKSLHSGHWAVPNHPDTRLVRRLDDVGNVHWGRSAIYTIWKWR